MSIQKAMSHERHNALPLPKNCGVELKYCVATKIEIDFHFRRTKTTNNKE